MLKKITALIFTFLFANQITTAFAQDKINIVTTIYPLYDFAKEVTAGVDNVNITLLDQTGSDMHSFTPTTKDLITILNSSILVYVGGPSDAWLDKVIKEQTDPKFTCINFMQLLGNRLLVEEIIEGMEDDHHDHDHDQMTKLHDNLIKATVNPASLDEHVWLSLKNAQILVSMLAKQLSAIDEKNAIIYAQNAYSYIDKLQALDKQYQTTVENAKNNTLIFADRFPFIYLIKDYKLNYYAAFPGCSAESNASFNTIAFLAQKLDENKLSYLITLEKSDNKIAHAIINNTKQQNVQVLKLNSIQSISVDEIAGNSYLNIMQNNLKVLKQALN